MAAKPVYDSLTVANYFLTKAGTAGLDALQIMKLVYIAHGFTLGAHGRALIEDDIEAWQYGPVVRRIYNELPGGSAPIIGPRSQTGEEVSEEDRAMLDNVFELYGHLPGTTLSNLTHREGSPWAKTWATYGKNAVIPQDLIERHYKTILDDYAKAKAESRPYVIPAL